MQLGSYQFSVNTAAYQELARSTEQRWAAIPRFGQLDALQDLGPGEDIITLRGVIFTEYRGGTEQPATMRDLMATGSPQLLVDGFGNVHGMWVVQRVEERQSVFGAAGAPRRQEFDITLRKYSDGFAL